MYKIPVKVILHLSGILVFFLFSAKLTLAQDTLCLRNGDILLVKVLNITDHQVKYKLSSDPAEAIHVTSKEVCSKVVYQDGRTVEFPPGIVDVEHKPLFATLPNLEYLGRNYISINPTDLLFRSVTINYEYFIKAGTTSLKFPLSIGLLSLGYPGITEYSDSPKGYRSKNKLFSIGIELYHYPKGQGRLRFFGGPGIEAGSYDNYEDQHGVDVIDVKRNSFFSLFLQIGILEQLSSHINLGLNGALGYSTASSKYTHFPFQASRAGLFVGYRF
jgi:hypothetical protein